MFNSGAKEDSKKGPKGDTGPRGVGIADILVDNQHLKIILSDGAEKELGSIAGPQGEQGKQGEKGHQGLMGPQGIQGERGLKGERGEQGEKGEKGQNGRDGEPGKDGVDGKHGLDGFPGAKGDIGKQGPQGEKGETGDKGDQGEAGKDGEAGSKGESGRDAPFSTWVKYREIDSAYFNREIEQGIQKLVLKILLIGDGPGISYVGHKLFVLDIAKQAVNVQNVNPEIKTHDYLTFNIAFDGMSYKLTTTKSDITWRGEIQEMALHVI